MEVSCSCLNLIDIKKIIKIGSRANIGVTEYCDFDEITDINVDEDSGLPNMVKITLTDINGFIITLYYNGLMIMRDKIISKATE